MHLPPLQPIGDFHTYISGDVTIHPSAAIAPGVLIQADPDSKITIAAGVCIGMGTVLHARDGWIDIRSGVNLGAGVLIFGSAKIGENACVGASTTIVNCAIAPQSVIAPGSLFSNTPETFTPTVIESATQSIQQPIRELITTASPEPSDAAKFSAHEKLPPIAPNLGLPPLEAIAPPIAEPISTFVDPTLQKPAQPSVTLPLPPNPFVPPPLLNQPFTLQPKIELTNTEVEADPQIPDHKPAEVNNASKLHGQAQLNQLMGKLFAHRQNPIQPQHPTE
jgi:carbon dioxide concentrating mechanism protein CcmN